jgi:UDP-N-acetylmuramate--alanine ligase
VAAAFADFIARIAPDGLAVLGADDPGSRALAAVAAQRGLRTTTFGLADDAEVRIEDLRLDGGAAQFVVVAGGRRLGEVGLQVPGSHNAVNALGVLALGLSLGLPFTDMVRGLGDFTGARRRFELKGVAGGVRVYDDYAHHPTKVRAALASARLVAGGGRVIAVFQPHLFSRTAHFAAEFGTALAGADAVVVMDVYAAREDPVPGVTGALVADAVPLPAGRVVYEPSWSAVPAIVAALARSGDLVVTIGAGDVTMLGGAVLAALEPAP